MLLRRPLTLHFQYEEESPGGRRCRAAGPTMLSAEMNRNNLAARQIQMTCSLLTRWTQRRALTSVSLAYEHMRWTEALASHGRRRRRLTPGRRPRSTVAAEAVQRDVDRLAAADGDAERTGARVGADRVADDVGRVSGSRCRCSGDVGGDAGLVELQRGVADGQRRVHDYRSR